MRRYLCAAVAAALLGLGVAGCKKAHNSGNDSMSIGGTRIVAAVRLAVR